MDRDHPGAQRQRDHSRRTQRDCGSTGKLEPQPRQFAHPFSLHGASAGVQEALKQYTVEGSFGHLLDAEADSLALSRFTVFEIEELMGLGEKYALPVLLYLFRRIERLIGSQQGRPSVIVLDEAWLMLGHQAFREKIKTWLKVMRKANCAVIMCPKTRETWRCSFCKTQAFRRILPVVLYEATRR